jgi:hypothetical protein
MNAEAINNRIQSVTKKIEDNKKPFTYVVIGGIILALISLIMFFILLARLMFGLGAGLVHAIAPSVKTNGSASANANGGLFSTPLFKFSTSTSSTTHGITLKKGKTKFQYARPGGAQKSIDN